MAEPAKSITPSVFDDKAFLARIEEIKTYMIDAYEGKPGVNPYQWLYDNVRPLEEGYQGIKSEKGKFTRGLPVVKTEESFKKLMAIDYKNIIPLVDGPNEFGKTPTNQDIGMKMRGP